MVFRPGGISFPDIRASGSSELFVEWPILVYVCNKRLASSMFGVVVRSYAGAGGSVTQVAMNRAASLDRPTFHAGTGQATFG
jgi:hypothetical protein